LGTEKILIPGFNRIKNDRPSNEEEKVESIRNKGNGALDLRKDLEDGKLPISPMMMNMD